uniref:Taste receptor type 2 n=1 Tax=Pyxicephalus adspersus TaxID=30357 RepID=A0AAV3A3J4_PYXAD|nr:TPA: hypothetical protein GDO54_014827 [Pyxicephalus adspersus]
MNFAFWMILLVIGVLESITGILLNTAIVAVQINVVKNKLRSNPSHPLTITMGLVNTLLLCMSIIWVMLYMTWSPISKAIEVINFFVVAASWFMFFSYWLTAWLCVYYFVSVTNFHQQIVVCLKRTFTSALPYLLLISGMGSFALSFTSLWDARVKLENKDNITLHATAIIPYGFSKLFIILATLFGCWIPFALTSISIGLTLSSILRHVWRLKQNNFNCSAPQLKAHLNAIRTMVLLFLLCTSSYIMALFAFEVEFSSDDIYLLNCLFIMSYPTVEAVILIQASSKLKKMFQIKCSRQEIPMRT